MTEEVGLSPLQRYDLDELGACQWLIGVDEAGRGALAGPVVAGACVIGRGFFELSEALVRSVGVNDSKQLCAAERESYLVLVEEFRASGWLDYEVGTASVDEIAEYNVLGATRLAMQRAVESLATRAGSWALPWAAADGPLFSGHRPVKIIVDGHPLRPFPFTHKGIVGGDSKSLCIAIASIAAKVARDRELCRLARDYPEYEFGVHKGYATRKHREAILTHGPSPVHRDLFLRKILARASAGG